MLDVTANDISNVNTIGYKSARVTFQDSLTQMQRGAAGADHNTGGSNAAQVGLGVGLGSIDNLMSGGARPDDRQPARRRDPGRRLLPDRARASRPPASSPLDADSLHPRRQLLGLQRGLPDHRRPVSTSSATSRPAATSRPRPTSRSRSRTAPPASRSTRPAACPTSTRHAADPRHRLPPDARHVPERRPASSARGGNPWTPRPTRARRRQTRRARAAPAARPPARSRCPTWTSSQTFTNMITAQRGFQANSRVISTADEMLQDLVNLKR